MRHLLNPRSLIAALAPLGVVAGVWISSHDDRGGPGRTEAPASPPSVDGSSGTTATSVGASATSRPAAGSSSEGAAQSGFFGAPPSIEGLAGLLGKSRLEEGGEPIYRGERFDLLGAPPAAQSRAWWDDQYYDFYFTRAVYGGGLGRGYFGRSWATDYPKADRQFLVVLGETLDLLRVPSRENAVFLDDPELRRFPFLYTLEVGGMFLSQPQVEGLRSYLKAGGFLVVDDFWGNWEWLNFEQQMRRVLPEAEIVDLPLDHEIFHVFYDIQEILQVPNVGNAQRGVTSECGPCRPHVRGIFDEDDRLMVVINWNTDLGDAWEWSEQAVYPFKYSNFAYKMAVNFIVYAMTH